MKNLRLISFAMLLLLMGGLVTFSSCKKDDDDSPSKTKMISGKKFFAKAMKIEPGVSTPGGVTITDLYPFLLDCVKDNYTTFSENGTFIDDEGATKCEPGDPQTINGTWEFMNDETQLKQTYGNEYQIYNIVELTNSVLKLSFSQLEDFEFGDGEQLYKVTLEFEAR
ncbi:MAG TPA: lipocalin family protein [Bacteroidales bacterium]|nr:lipocalin family protein [Bacteroidales bacterium]